MAIYRAESGRRSLLIGAAAAVIGLVLGFAIGRLSAPGLGAQLDELRAQVAPIHSSLEVVRTEYPKLLAGGADPGGAPSALSRVETTYAVVSAALGRISGSGQVALGARIADLRAAIDTRAPQADVDAAVDAVAAALDGILPPGSGSPGG